MWTASTGMDAEHWLLAGELFLEACGGNGAVVLDTHRSHPRASLATAARESPDASGAEGATAPETLRPKDRVAYHDIWKETLARPPKGSRSQAQRQMGQRSAAFAACMALFRRPA
jgi:hypothetical protein